MAGLSFFVPYFFSGKGRPFIGALQYAHDRPDTLLIVDDFGLGSMDHQQQLDFMEIIEDRHARKSTIISSQLPPANWFDLFSDETIADAFLDRMIHTSHRIEFKNGDSLRKKK